MLRDPRNPALQGGEVHGRHHKTLTKFVAWIAIAAFLGFGLVAGGLAPDVKTRLKELAKG